MISVVLYGRNDNYGYNLHKRATISLNCIAEVLTFENDEIIFVDYNTPNDFPTFPEAIADMLTSKAKSKLRILRVRPEAHQSKFEGKTTLKIMEHFARNVGVRNSNSSNRWILSTNTDMIFVPRESNSLSELVQNLPKGIYGIPRFEIPETIWEGYQRINPKSILLKTSEFGKRFHLNDVAKDDFGFHACGDFQLIERKDLFDNYGFEERIMNGLHIDSNINKRLAIKYGYTSDASSLLLGYHCNHGKVLTPLHKNNPKTLNEFKQFVEDISESSANHQAKKWGLIDKEIEEISLNSPTEFLFQKTVKKILKYPQLNFTYSNFDSNNFDKVQLNPNHIFPFLLDKFIYLKRNIQIIWFGKADKLYNFFSEALYDLDFINKLKTYDSPKNNDNLFDYADHLIINLSNRKYELDKEIKNYALTILNHEIKRFQNNKNLRPIYIINSLHSSYEDIIREIFITNRDNPNTGILTGYINTDFLKDFYNWTSEMIVGDNAYRNKSFIECNSLYGTLAYGPYKLLPVGKYILNIELFKNLKFFKEKKNFIRNIANILKFSIKNPFIKVEIVFDEHVYYTKEINILKKDFIAEIPFEILDENFLKKIQFRVINFGFNGCIGSFKVNRV